MRAIECCGQLKHDSWPVFAPDTEDNDMRIVSWNCNMAYGRKAERVMDLRPDVVVVQECAEQDVLAAGGSSQFWVGKNRHKGLGVIVFGDARAQLDQSSNLCWPWFLNVHIGELHLHAVWASVKSNTWRYVRVAHQMLDASQHFLEAPLAVATGDFNSNTIFDSKHGTLTHTKLVERFATLGFTSVYHDKSGQEHGAEQTPTQYMYRHPDKPFHLDYAFVSAGLRHGATLEIGKPEEWLSLSDHMPLVLDC